MVFGSCPVTKSGNSQGLSWIFYPQLLIHFTKRFSICECQRLLALLFSRRCCIPTIIDEYPVSYSYMMVRRCPWSWSHTTFNALQSRDRWDHCNPPHQLHDDTKHVYTVILQHLSDDARNIIAIWNDWECWQPKWLLKVAITQNGVSMAKSSTCLQLLGSFNESLILVVYQTMQI